MKPSTILLGLIFGYAWAAPPRVRQVQLEKFYSGSLGGAVEGDAWAYYSLNFQDQEAATAPDGTNITLLSDLGATWDLVIQVE